MVMLQRCSVYWRENGHVKEWSVQWRENDHVREAASLIEGEWSCYGGGQFKGGRMVLQRWSV